VKVFVEKRFGRALFIRLTESNVPDASKEAFFDKFDKVAPQLAHGFD